MIAYIDMDAAQFADGRIALHVTPGRMEWYRHNLTAKDRLATQLEIDQLIAAWSGWIPSGELVLIRDK